MRCIPCPKSVSIKILELNLEPLTFNFDLDLGVQCFSCHLLLLLLVSCCVTQQIHPNMLHSPCLLVCLFALDTIEPSKSQKPGLKTKTKNKQEATAVFWTIDDVLGREVNTQGNEWKQTICFALVIIINYEITYTHTVV